MPRVKVKMSLISDARDRAKAFKQRKAGLVKKANELAKLCDVDVALVVCAGPDGGGAPPVVWESDPGVVIDRYRRLPADKRARHTHLDYIDVQLSKEDRRLDKKRRQGLKALACPDEAVLKDMDLEELLASIDAALLATAERQKALGVADDDGQHQQLGQQVSSDAVVPGVGQGDDPPFVSGDDLDDILAWVDELMWDGAEPLSLNNASTMQPASGAVIQYNNGNDVDMGGNHQCQAQTLPGNGENGCYGGQLPCHAYQPNTTVTHPDYHGFQCAGKNYVDMDDYSQSQSQVLAPSNANAYDGAYNNQAWWGADESSCDAVAVLPAAAAYPPSLDITGNPVHMPPQQEHPAMGIGSLMDADAGGHEYEVSGCFADDYFHFQFPDASQHFGGEPELHYLSDMTPGISYYDDLEAAAAAGEAQVFAQSHSYSGTPQFSTSTTSSEQSQSDVGHQYRDPGVQHFWVMDGQSGSTDVATASDRARGGGTWANSGDLYQPWISVYQ